MNRTQPTSPRACSRLCWAAALLCSLPSGVALAQQPPKESPADEKFNAGREAVTRGDLLGAARLFRKSQELEPAAGTLLNLAKVEEQLGQLAAALDHYQTALKQLPEGDERVKVAQEAAAKLAPRVPTLKIERSAVAPPTIRVELYGPSSVAPLVGAEKALDPGAYAALVTAPGHEPRRYDIQLEEGKREVLTVEPGKEIAPSSAPPPPPPPRSTTTPAVGFALAGLGIMGLGMGAVTGALAIVKKGQLDTTCPNAGMCSADGLRLEASGKTLAAISTTSLVLGVVGAGTGLALVLVNREPKAPAATGGAPPAVSLGVAPLPGGGFAGLRGAF